jgi:hypothetical protein
MNQMTITSTPAVHDPMSEMTPVARILFYFRDRLECLSADMITLMIAINHEDVTAISQLETEIRDAYGWPDVSYPVALNKPAGGPTSPQA